MRRVVGLPDTRTIRALRYDASTGTVVITQGASGIDKALTTVLVRNNHVFARARIPYSESVIGVADGLILLDSGRVLNEQLATVATIARAVAIISSDCLLRTTEEQKAERLSIRGGRCGVKTSDWPEGVTAVEGTHGNWALSYQGADVYYTPLLGDEHAWIISGGNASPPGRNRRGPIQAIDAQGKRALVGGLGFLEELDGTTGTSRILRVSGMTILDVAFVDARSAIVAGVTDDGRVQLGVHHWGRRFGDLSSSLSGVGFMPLVPADGFALSLGEGGDVYSLTAFCPS